MPPQKRGQFSLDDFDAPAAAAPGRFRLDDFDPPAAPKAPSWLDSVGTFLDRATKPFQPAEINKAVQAVNPLEMTGAQSFGEVAQSEGILAALGKYKPVAAAGNILKGQGKLAEDAQKDFEAGNYGEGVVKALHYLVPMFGPQMQNAGEELQRGEIAAGLGDTAAIASNVVGPAAAGRVVGAINRALPTRKVGGLNALTPAEAEAVAFGQANKVPVDAATATGNSFVKGAQSMLEKGTLSGSIVGDKARAAQGSSLATLGEQLAAKGYPTATTPETAGTSLRSALTTVAMKESAAADANYSVLRGMEANPGLARRLQVATKDGAPVVADVPLGVDLRGAKSGLDPIYQQLKREGELAPLMGPKANALRALDRLVSAPDAAPLSVVDGALGELKTSLRKAQRADGFLTDGDAALAKTIEQLSGAVDDAAAAAGPQAVEALQKGRGATVAKHGALDVLDELRAEPVQTMKLLTSAKDAGIAKLREVSRIAPGEMPKIGRAWLDEQLGVATEAGGFAHADKLYADWQKLGASTKAVIFKDAGYVKDLDNFFLLAKKLAENPNPSGTAKAVAAGAHVSTAAAGLATGNLPLVLGSVASEITGGLASKFLRSRRGVQLLTQGMRLQVSPKLARGAAGAKVAADLARYAGAEWYRSPVFADEDEGRQP